MENTQHQNQEELNSEAMAAKEGVEGGNSGNGLEKEDPGFKQKSPQVLTNLDAFLKNEVIRLQALMIDLESKRQKAERQVQSNQKALEKLSQVEKQAQEVISESIKLQRENEAIFRENAKEKTVDEDAKNEPLSLQQIWR